MNITKKGFGTAAVAAALLAVAGAANAVTINMDNTNVGAFGAGVFGTVTLTQNAGNVDVSVGLRGDLNFVNTGGKVAFGYNVTNAVAGDTGNIQFNSGAATGYVVVAPATQAGYGSFLFGIDCTAAKPTCENGAPGQRVDPLTFTVSGAVIAEFVKNLDQWYFTADVICVSGACNGATGAIAGGTGQTPPPDPVPEPGTLALLGLGLLGLGISRRRK